MRDSFSDMMDSITNLVMQGIFYSIIRQGLDLIPFY